MTGMKLNFISQGMLQWGVCLVKVSVGCALLRIATQKRWRFPIIGITIFMVIYTAGCFTVSIVYHSKDFELTLVDPFHPVRTSRHAMGREDSS